MSARTDCTCVTHTAGPEKKSSLWFVICNLWKRKKIRCSVLSSESRDSSEVYRSLRLAVQEGRSEDVKSIVHTNAAMRRDGVLETVLMMSLHRGMTCVVDWLVEVGLDREALDDALIAASKRGDSVTVGRLVDAKASVDAKNRFGLTALHLTAERGDVETLSLLLKFGAYPKVRDVDGRTPLHYAVRSCSLESIRKLAEFGAEFDCVDRHGCSLLHEAVKRQIVFDGSCDIRIVRHPKAAFLNMVDFLLKNVPDVQGSVRKFDGSGNSCFHYAAQNLGSDSLEILDLLIRAGSSVNHLNVDGMTPLRMSVHKQNVSVARALVERGADVDARAPDGSTPLHAAVILQHLDLTKLLLQSGANVDARTSDGVTPFQIALYWPTRYSVINFLSPVIPLIQCGANVFFSAGYRPNPFVNRGFMNFLIEPLTSLLPMLIHALTNEHSVPLLSESDPTFEKLSKFFYQRCVNEIVKMKNDRILSYTYYELLICDTNTFVKCLRNKHIMDVLESRCHLSKFEIYGLLIETRYRKALRRIALLKSGLDFFNRHVRHAGSVDLPQECIEHILTYLQDSQLKQIDAVIKEKQCISVDGCEMEPTTEYMEEKLLTLQQNYLQFLQN